MPIDDVEDIVLQRDSGSTRGPLAIVAPDGAQSQRSLDKGVAGAERKRSSIRPRSISTKPPSLRRIIQISCTCRRLYLKQKHFDKAKLSRKARRLIRKPARIFCARNGFCGPGQIRPGNSASRAVAALDNISWETIGRSQCALYKQEQYQNALKDRSWRGSVDGTQRPWNSCRADAGLR